MNKLGDWSVSQQLIDFVQNSIKPTTILELGSGFGSSVLSKICPIYSVEHDRKFVNLYDSVNYIYCPIEGNWYNADALRSCLGQIPEWDLVIVDGPPGIIGRKSFIDHQSMFNLDSCKALIIDDINRAEESGMFEVLRAGKSATTFNSDEKSFGVIYYE